MDLRNSEAEIAFRQKARTWLAQHAPKEKRPAKGAAAAHFDRAWQRKLYEHGWAGVNWPKEHGGLGLTSIEQVIWYEEMVRAHAPHHINTMYVALMHAGPTLIARGSEAQKAAHLKAILSGEAIWCQGFSEPGAGSDLAALRTRGDVDGDHIVVNGAKMWTTDAQYADRQELLIRTDPGSQRHKGLTWLICDMHTPGIEVKPIRTMLQDEHVNMVYYDNVRIPIANVVGDIGGGWSTAMATLAFERGLGFIGDQLELYERVLRAIALAKRARLEDGTRAIEDSAIAQRLAALKAEAMAIKAMTLTFIAESEGAREPGPNGSLMKLMVTSAHKALSQVVSEMLGWEFMAFDGDRTNHPWTYEYLWSWVFTIAGGSSEIQREIVADRLLELPKSR
jgi:alkylation response protein AidB-like acyl-CoA dehydrogenase